MGRVLLFPACRHIAAVALAGLLGLAVLVALTRALGHGPTAPVLLSVFAVTTGFSLAAMWRCQTQTAAQYREEMERLARLAEYDDLSGLANRRAFTRHLARELQLARWYDHPLALVIIDLDNFKSINDRYGHVVGDAVLARFGALLQELCRASDVVARLGGDEFAIILRQAGERQARSVIARLQAILEEGPILTIERDGICVSVCASAGYAVLSPDMADITDLIEAADAAQYARKAERASFLAGQRAATLLAKSA